MKRPPLANSSTSNNTTSVERRPSITSASSSSPALAATAPITKKKTTNSLSSIVKEKILNQHRRNSLGGGGGGGSATESSTDDLFNQHHLQQDRNTACSSSESEPPPPPPPPSFPPDRFKYDLEQLHSTLLERMTKKQNSSSQKLQKLEWELETFRQEVLELRTENYAVFVGWNEFVRQRVSDIQKEQKERQKMFDQFQHVKKKEADAVRRKQFYDQQAKDKKDFGNSSYYELAMLRLQLKESEDRIEMERNIMMKCLSMSQEFSDGYNQVWRKFDMKIGRELRALAMLDAAASENTTTTRRTTTTSSTSHHQQQHQLNETAVGKRVF